MQYLVYSNYTYCFIIFHVALTTKSFIFISTTFIQMDYIYYTQWLSYFFLQQPDKYPGTVVWHKVPWTWFSTNWRSMFFSLLVNGTLGNPRDYPKREFFKHYGCSYSIANWIFYYTIYAKKTLPIFYLWYVCSSLSEKLEIRMKHTILASEQKERICIFFFTAFKANQACCKCETKIL